MSLAQLEDALLSGLGEAKSDSVVSRNTRIRSVVQIGQRCWVRSEAIFFSLAEEAIVLFSESEEKVGRNFHLKHYATSYFVIIIGS